MWPKGNGNLVASKIYTTLSRHTSSKAYANLTRITVHDLERLYVPKDILAEERRLHRLAVMTRVRYAHPDDPASAEDHLILTARPAPRSTPPRTMPVTPRATHPAPKPTAPYRKHPLAQTRTSLADGLTATLNKRAKQARSTFKNPL